MGRGHRDKGTSLIEATAVAAALSSLTILAVNAGRTEPGRADDARAAATLHFGIVAGLTADGTDLDSLAAAEPSLIWQSAPSTAADQLSASAMSGTVRLAVRSMSGRCLTAVIDTGARVTTAELAGSADCAGDDVPLPG
jgi:hypothetical protein